MNTGSTAARTKEVVVRLGLVPANYVSGRRHYLRRGDIGRVRAGPDAYDLAGLDDAYLGELLGDSLTHPTREGH